MSVAMNGALLFSNANQNKSRQPCQIITILSELLMALKSLHFLIRDRIDDEVVFSFRVLVDPK
jgi:hypothetical protein